MHLVTLLALHRFWLDVRYPSERLIGGREITKHSNVNPFQKGTGQRPQTSLIPEYMYVLPLPRDFLYIMSAVEKFMPELERKIQVSMIAHSLFSEFPSPCGETKNTLMSEGTLSDEPSFPLLNTFADLLDQATTIYPLHAYERMEFLGTQYLVYCTCTFFFPASSTHPFHLQEILSLPFSLH